MGKSVCVLLMKVSNVFAVAGLDSSVFWKILYLCCVEANLNWNLFM